MGGNKRELKSFFDLLVGEHIDQIKKELPDWKNKVMNHKVIEYSYITKLVCEISEAKAEMLKDNIDEVQKELYNEEITEKEINLLKILENIKLDLVRKTEKENQDVKLRKILMKLHQSTEEYKKDRIEFEDKLKRSESNIDRTQSQIITILSIFAGIIIAFFGGISLLGSAIENFNKSNKFMTYALVIIIGLIMFNVIYLLLYTISKLVRIPITIRKCTDECNGCKNINPLKQLVVRYPIWVFFNISAIWGIFLISLLYLILKQKLFIGWWLVGFYVGYFLIGIVILILLLWKVSQWGLKKMECDQVNISVNRTSEESEFHYNIENIENLIKGFGSTLAATIEEDDDEKEPRN